MPSGEPMMAMTWSVGGEWSSKRGSFLTGLELMLACCEPRLQFTLPGGLGGLPGATRQARLIS